MPLPLVHLSTVSSTYALNLASAVASRPSAKWFFIFMMLSLLSLPKVPMASVKTADLVTPWGDRKDLPVALVYMILNCRVVRVTPVLLKRSVATHGLHQ